MSPYHHGALRRAVLDAALDVLATEGPEAVRLRDLARAIGVSHAAPAHHFGDRAGLLTAVAVEGFDLLGVALEAEESLLEQGIAYVRFGIEQRAHFTVMFRPDLYRADDPDVLRARERASAALRRGTRGDRLTGIAAWSLAHGFATLWNTGNLPPELGPDPSAAARNTLSKLAPGAEPPGRSPTE
jgi:AcrR family transcriptional regulator